MQPPVKVARTQPAGILAVMCSANLFVLFDLAIAKVHDTVCVQGDVRLMRYENDCVALLVEYIQYSHNFGRGG